MLAEILFKLWSAFFPPHLYVALDLLEEMFIGTWAAAGLPACIHLKGIGNQQILWNIIMLNMEACGNDYLQEHIPLPYLDARL